MCRITSGVREEDVWLEVRGQRHHPPTPADVILRVEKGKDWARSSFKECGESGRRPGLALRPVLSSMLLSGELQVATESGSGTVLQAGVSGWGFLGGCFLSQVPHPSCA